MSTPTPSRSNLQLGPIGNCSFNALIDERASVQWCCLPRPDGDPVFFALIDDDGRALAERRGHFSIEIEDFARAEQSYLRNTAVLQTTLWDRHGNGVQITDFAPRFSMRGRMFRPLMLVRRLEPRGRPRVRIRLRPGFDYGATQGSVTRGSNHLRFVNSGLALRLTTDLPVTYIADETPFLLDQPGNLLFGADETLASGISATAREFEENTINYWRTWVRPLGLPLEWQDAVVRAAITLKLCTFEETGAILAAMTTSIPEAQDTQRNWDYRFCWLRDAFFVVRALNALSEVATMENYLGYLANLEHHAARQGRLQPVYGIGMEADLPERTIENLAGYRGHRPVRAGNAAFEHDQYDVYGNVVLAATQAFFDARLLRQPQGHDFERLEWAGERAYALHNQPDAGMWELRTRAGRHTSSALMCWAACDRLAKIAARLGRTERHALWAERAREIRERILTEGWNEQRRSFVDRFGGDALDAGVLLIGEVGLLDAQDPRWIATVEAIGRELKNGTHVYRYATPDDFGTPRTAFTICTFWYIDALARIGRTSEAREMFERLLATRNGLGLLSEDIDVHTGELWGNFPQTYSMVGIINCATRLSRRWETVL